MHHALIVSRDEKLINFIIQNQVDHNFKIVHKSEIFQGLKILSREKFDIMIYDIDAQDLDVLYALKIAKQLNRDLHSSHKIFLFFNNVSGVLTLM